MKSINISVIITSFNKGNYLAQCLDSLLASQVKGLQLIIVDDGSTDQSRDIIRDYAKRFPQLLIIEQDNHGVSHARNRGLELAAGEYITFLDADDYMDANVLVKLYRLARNKDADTAIGQISCFDEERRWSLSYMDRMFSASSARTVRHILNNPELHLTPSVCNKLFRRAFIARLGVQFDESIQVGEDLLFTERCLIASNRTIVQPLPLLYYRTQTEGGSLSRQGTFLYLEQLLELQNKISAMYGELHRADSIHYIEARQLRFLIDTLANTGRSLYEQDRTRLMRLVQQFVSILVLPIDFAELSFKQKLLLEVARQNDELHLEQFISRIVHAVPEGSWMERNGEYYHGWMQSFEPYADCLKADVSKITYRLEVLEKSEQHFIIGGYAFIPNISTEGCRKKLVCRNGNTVIEYDLATSLRTDVTHQFAGHGVNYDQAGFVNTTIDLDRLPNVGEWQVFIQLAVGKGTVVEQPLEIRAVSLRNRLMPTISNKLLYATRYKRRRYLSVVIKPASIPARAVESVRQLAGYVRFILYLLKSMDFQALFCMLLYVLFGTFLRKKNRVLIGERRDTAQDNSYHLFRYLRKNNPSLPVYYVIDRNSRDYDRVKPYGNIVLFGSIRHTMYLLTSYMTINSYIESANMYTGAYKNIKKQYPNWKAKHKVFLQHGVIGVSRVNHSLHRNRTGYSLFVVSSPFEKQHIVEEFGYTNQEVIVTGLARWDHLEDSSGGNEILLMPTWRKWIKSEDQLEKSNYWRTYHSLLSSPRLHALLEQRDWKLTFYPHYKTQQLFGSLPAYHERIQVVRQGEETVQRLLKRHRLLITDYSTVSFDFAYMDKPVMFYQFDYDEFYSSHYNEGPIDHKNDLFGKVLGTEEQLLDELAASGLQADPVKMAQSNRYMNRGKKHTATIVEELLRLSR
ncbi:bifunctional glycosyltransferase/CDP-glycerol:glycerophosphate glycerophosphotransferase [Paenibacillus kobensis]|uniref:bifunctional glycosyltransferase/CDP-glycerol:glycerophosphate glycerophosphotransferase n=1 Tax=Paenibacillus kobensis TaxID=59841 RepID=UPI000FD7E21E|nr:CDP-glycerol glycerophosphotransferase family protein [Paenibacillus kobensis]